ncbi:hypothetical protein K523DRAFT_273683 [Schizophyllum commune Tattone D]|nr:hypothetical protein K523DRAFT_273683 [Schizophyllum commune Tattone D]
MSAGRALADRISSSKVYLLSEMGKRKRERTSEDIAEVEEEDVEMNEDPSIRANAILLCGPPITQLPTARLFAYATHYDCPPLGLEWVDDETCVLVYETVSQAHAAFDRLTRSPGVSAEGYVTAKTFPASLWPPDERVSASLGERGTALRAPIRMRWARHEDVKRRGAHHESEFYRRYGEDAGKTPYDPDAPPHELGRKRKRGEPENRASLLERLDNELDSFLAEGEAADAVLDPEEVLAQTAVEEPVAEVPAAGSRMRSDLIAGDGRTLLDRMSDPATTPSLEDRLTSPPPKRTLGRMRAWDGPVEEEEDDLLPRAKRARPKWRERAENEALEYTEDRGRRERGGRGRRRRGGRDRSPRDRERGTRRRGSPVGRERDAAPVGKERDAAPLPERGGRSRRPQKSAQELDDELDAFLNDREVAA